MENLRLIETAYRIQHQHGDGTWGPMEEEPAIRHHSPVEHDPERSWLRGRIFRCSSCGEAMTIVPGSEGSAPVDPGLGGD